MVDPFQDRFWINKVGHRPLDHCFVTNGNGLYDIRVLICQAYGSRNLLAVVFDVTLSVVWARTLNPGIRLWIPDGLGPGVLRLDPSTEHDVHFEAWILGLNLANSLKQTLGLRELGRVIGAQQLDIHCSQNPHIVNQLLDCRPVLTS